MAHVTFVHGISNKPPAEDLTRAWVSALADDQGIDLDYEHVGYELVYWADLLYAQPLAGGQAESLEAVDLGGAEDVDLTWLTDGQGEDAEVMARLAARLGVAVAPDPVHESPPAPDPDVGESLELLPPILARRVMRTFLRDVHHYLFNTSFSPRPGDQHAIQDEIRRRMVEALGRGAEHEPPHVLVTHSMGTVIAYDCLQRVPGCPDVDGLFTVGSPLGLDEVQHCLKPQWSRRDGFPGRTLSGPWVNVFDRLDVVAAADPYIAGDFRRGGADAVVDVNEPNWGRWRHDIGKYLRGQQLRTHLADALGVDRP